MTSLISISDLIHESWIFFKSDWKAITLRNAWMIPLIIVYVTFYAIGLATNHPFLVLLGILVLMIGSILVTLNVTRYLLTKEGGASQATKDKGLAQLFLPALLIGLLSVLGVLGGSLLFLLPGIWFGVASSFAYFAFLEEGVTGAGALGRSMELVKGRWWKSLWRLFIPGLVFQIIIGIISSAIFIVPVIIAAIGGVGAMMSFSEGGSGALGAASLPILIISALLFIVAFVINILLSLVGSGLMQVVQTKLFHSLKSSR